MEGSRQESEPWEPHRFGRLVEDSNSEGGRAEENKGKPGTKKPRGQQLEGKEVTNYQYQEAKNLTDQEKGKEFTNPIADLA